MAGILILPGLFFFHLTAFLDNGKEGGRALSQAMGSDIMHWNCLPNHDCSFTVLQGKEVGLRFRARCFGVLVELTSAALVWSVLWISAAACLGRPFSCSLPGYLQEWFLHSGLCFKISFQVFLCVF